MHRTWISPWKTLARFLTPIVLISCTGGDGTSPPTPEEPSVNLNIRPVSNSLYLNQLAYHPEEVKRIIVAKQKAKLCYVADVAGQVLMTVPLLDVPAHPDFELALASCDISSLKQEGSFTVSLGEDRQELYVRIERDPWRNLLRASQKTYYYQRASMELAPEYAGEWARPAGHQDLSLAVRKTQDASDGKRRDVPGGWYDAGDYGKYMVNGGFAVGVLLLAAEHYPRQFSDDLNIPESHNGVIDLLDEVRYELDWFLTMQDDDAGVFFKVGPLEWPSFILPHEDLGTRYITGKSTASTLNFAATAAQASRIYKSIDPLYAARLLQAAERAWSWANTYPQILAPATDPTGGTGGYGDESMDDEFLWAAVELARATELPLYRQQAESRLLQMSARSKHREPLWWANVQGLAFLSASSDSAFSPAVQTHVTQELLTYADEIIERSLKNPFAIAYSGKDFIWGSNGGLANQGMILLFAYRNTGKAEYRQAAQDILHYLLGRNIHSLSFVTGFGQNTARHPHHRPSGGDAIEAPVPGFLVGGPNSELNDKASVKYPINRQGPYCYVDQLPSYASNEVAINWNAPLTYLLAGLRDIF